MVVKHCSRKFSDSSTSKPEGGSGRFWRPELEAVDDRSGMGFTGLSFDVIAWTLVAVLVEVADEVVR